MSVKRKVTVPVGTCVARRPGGGGERFVLREDGPLEPAQLLAGLEPELARRAAAAVLVDGERVGLPAAAVEREHELAAQALAQRVLLTSRSSSATSSA